MTITLDRPSSLEQVAQHVPKTEPPPGPAVPQRSRRPKRRGRVLRWVTGIMLGIGIAIWLLVVLGLGVATGPVGVALCVGLPMLPMLMLLATFRWINRADPAPGRHLFVAFTWGATVAAALSSVLEILIGLIGDPLWLSAPIVEEFAKGSILVLLLVFVRSEFDGIVDGIVYAGFVATGFAFTENIGYIAMGYTHGNVAGAVEIFTLRGVFTPFTHPLITVMFGIGLGICAVSARRAARIVAPIIGFGAAVGLHMLFDFAAFHADVYPVVFYVSLGFFALLFFAMIWIVGRIRKRELRVVGNHLGIYAQHGWFADSELGALSSFKGRRRARGWAAFTHGKNGKRAMTDVQRSATKLGLLRRKLAAGRAVPDFTTRQHELLTKLSVGKAVLAATATNHPFGIVLTTTAH